MKTKLLIAAALALASASASAQQPIDIQALAKQTHLTERQVRMVFTAACSYAEYRTSYARAEDAVRKALGNQDPRELANRVGIKDVPGDKLASN
jgi:hypothetical protein